MGFIFNTIKYLLKLSIKLSLYLAVFAAIIILFPNLPPYTKFSSIELAPTQPRVGPLAPNGILNNAEVKYKGKLLGPEAFQLLNGELYTSLATGEIVKISPGGHVTFVTKVGQPCSGLTQEHICGRPLGFQIDDMGKTLYLADAYHGIWRVDLKTDKKQLLVSPRVAIEKRLPKLFNSIALGQNGDFYWTDSSSDFHLKDGAISILADPSGRVLHYNAAKNESKVLVDNVWFANGLVVSPTNEFLLFSETCRYRLMKYYMAGPKKGKTEVFVDGLPGVPDNMRVLPDGSGVLVGLYIVFDDENPMLTRSMSNVPVVRKFLARLQRLIEIPFEYLNTVYPHVIFEEIVYNIGHFKGVSGLVPPMSGLMQLDWNGNIVATYFNTDKSLGHISDAIVYGDKLYTGSPHNQDFIGSVPVPPLLKKAFEPASTTKPPKVETKPVEQPKPKVEKPKPKVEPQSEQKLQDTPKVQQKSKIEPKPKLEEKREVPKVENKPQKQAKPVETTTPPTTQPPKPTPAPVKPEAIKKTPPKQEQPRPTTPKPEIKTTPSPKPTEKTTPPPPKPTEKTTPPPPKPTEKTTPPPPKPTEKTTPPPPKVSDKNKEQPKKAPKPETPKPTQPTPKEQIPIKEEIPLDTEKPTKEKLKVIKKGGVPTEMPVPRE